MAINERLIDTAVVSGCSAEPPEEGLILHLDANDVDSYDGDGDEWVDISTFDKLIPLSDNAASLKLNLDASDSTSYGGTGTTWTDLSGNNNNGTISGATYSGAGGYFSFDGSNDKVDFTGRPVTATSDITIEAWVKFEAGGGNYPYVAMIGQGNNIAGSSLSISRHFGTDNFYSFVGDQLVNTGISLSNSTWYHLVVTQSGTSLKQYIDGSLVNTATVSTNNFANNFRLGYFYDTNVNQENNEFKGDLSNVRVYDTALSPSDIGQNYRHGRDFVYTSLIPDTNLELHLDADSFPQYGEAGYSNTPTTWTALTGSNGTITGATFDGELGNWLDFDGSNDYIDCGSASNIIPAGSDFTIETWVSANNNTTNTFWTVVSAVQSGTPYGGFQIYNHHTSDNWGIALNKSGTWTSLDTGVDIEVNQWVHLVFTYDGSNMKLFVDGEERFSSSQSGSLQYAGNVNLEIGRNLSSYAPIKVGQVRMYDLELSDSDIRQNYNFTKPSYPNGYDGTITGATWNSGGYFDFDGTDDYVTNNSISLDTSQDFTFCGWVYPTADSTWQRLFSWGTLSTEVLVQKRGDNNKARIIGRVSNSIKFDVDGAVLTNNQWHFIAVTGDGSNVKMYVNDNAAVTDNISGTNNYNNLQLGTGAGTTEDFYGRISKFRLYDKVLTQTEIDNLYCEGE